MKEFEIQPLVSKVDMSYEECQSFAQWYRRAKPREVYVYYEGSSLTNTMGSIAVKNITWKYATSGWVYLVQKRTGSNYFCYLAIKAENKLDRLIPLDYNQQQRRKTFAERKLEANG